MTEAGSTQHHRGGEGDLPSLTFQARGAPTEPGKSQWALIWREFRRRPRAIVCGLLVIALATMAIFAPLLANDRPLAYRGYNRFRYQESLRTASVMIARLLSSREQADGGERQEAARVLRQQIETASSMLVPEQAGELAELGRRLNQLAAEEATSGNLTELRRLRTRLRREFDADDVRFGSHWHFPVFASLDWLEVLFLALNIVLLSGLLWGRGLRWMTGDAHPAFRRWVAGTIIAGLPIVCAGLWWLSVPERVERTNYKAAAFQAAEADASNADVVYEMVLWPPVPYGLDENDLGAQYLPPAFWPSGDGKAGEETNESKRPWDAPHWLGTDRTGRDVLSRMIWGGRISLAVGVVAVSIYVTLGIIVGSIAGYFRGAVDIILSRIIEVVIVFPSFFLILTIVAFVGPSIFNIMVVIGLTGWTGVARLVRGEFLRLGEQEFVLASRALGYSPLRIIFRHMLPNALAPVLVAATFGVAGAILIESALSFIGLGITVPKPSWGGMLKMGRDAIATAPWLIYFPGFAIFLTITAYNLVGEAFRDAADPRLRGQIQT